MTTDEAMIRQLQLIVDVLWAMHERLNELVRARRVS